MEKRSLTDTEIKNILSFIQPIKGLPHDIATSISERQYDGFAKQLHAIKIYPAAIPKLRNILKQAYIKSQIEPGKSIGALASTSIGEKHTQTSLSSKHHAGKNQVTLLEGVPRLEEIINMTRDIKTPSMEIYFDIPLDNQTNLTYIRTLAQSEFEFHDLQSLLYDHELINNRKLTLEEQTWYMFNSIFYASTFEECTWSIRLIFKIHSLFQIRKSLADIAKIIESQYAELHCVASPDNVGIIDVYIDTSNLSDPEELARTLGSLRQKNKKEDVNSDDFLLLINNDNKEYYFIRDLVLPSVLAIPISGIEGIIQCFYNETKKQTWYVTTKGSNLKVVLRHPFVDYKYTKTNNLWEIYENLGIEATRISFHQELEKLISVSNRHIDLLINAMTYNGRPQAATRYGIDKHQVGVLAKTCFEQPWENLLHAAFLGEKDDISGVSSSIMTGNPPKIGTGMIGLVRQQFDLDRMSYEYNKQSDLIDEEQEMEHAIRQFNFPLPMSRTMPNFNKDQQVSNKPILRRNLPMESVINTKTKVMPFTYVESNKELGPSGVTRINMSAEELEKYSQRINGFVEQKSDKTKMEEL